jgi:hypothetical protein
MDQMNSSLADFVVTGQGGFQQLAVSAIEEIIKIGLQWLESKILMLAFGKVAGAQEITTQAAIAGAGGTASMAAAPFPLDLTAPEFGVSMMAESLSYLGMLSAAQGAVLPDQEMLVHTHPKEMILPANIAEHVMQTAGGANGKAQNITYAPVVHVPPGGSAKEFEKFIDGHFDRYMRSQMRRKGVR